MCVFVVVGLLGAGGFLGASRYWAQQALRRAQVAIRMQDWATARDEFRRYLDVFPGDESARLNLAEAHFKDTSVTSDRAVSSAIQQLHYISRESPLWPTARIREARMILFAQQQPHRAELLLQELLAADPDNLDGEYVLWKLYDLTGRSHLAEPQFRKVFAATPIEGRPVRLREWYLSQFYPATANPELDQLMGFHQPGTARNAITELQRLEAFRENEPTAAVNHATVARWYSLEGNPKEALRLLQEALEATESPLEDQFFVSTLVQVLFDLGEFDAAKRSFQAWPGARSGYEYSRLDAILADEIDQDYKHAIDGYRQVVSVWPGQADWRIQYRMARCLAKAGNTIAAEEMRQRAKKVELLMEEEVHTPLRRTLASPDKLETCQRMSQFYEQLGLTFEAEQWRTQVEIHQKKM